VPPFLDGRRGDPGTPGWKPDGPNKSQHDRCMPKGKDGRSRESSEGGFDEKSHYTGALTAGYGKEIMQRVVPIPAADRGEKEVCQYDPVDKYEKV